MIASEYTSIKILDSNLYDAFSFSHTVQVLFGVCRVNVRAGIVSSPTVYQKAYTLIMAMFSVGLYVTLGITYLPKYKINANLYRTTVVMTLIHLSAYLLNLIHVRFTNNNHNADFVISMQDLDRCMKLDQNKSVNAILCKVNTVSTLAIVSITLLLIIITAAFAASLPLILAVSTFTFSESTNIIELNHCSNLVVYYAIRIRFVNSIITNHLNRISKYESQDILMYSKQFMRELAAKTHELTYSDVDVYLEEIFKNYSQYQNIYQFQMFLFTCKLIIGSAIYLQIVVLGLQLNLIGILEWITILCFVFSNAFIALFMCIRCEMFLREVMDTKQLCITIMSIHTQGPFREKARKMLKIIEASPPRFSVYAMWNIEGRFLLRLFSIITAMFVTELQLILL